MSVQVPTRQALRYLSCLCRSIETTVPASTSVSNSISPSFTKTYRSEIIHQGSIHHGNPVTRSQHVRLYSQNRGKLHKSKRNFGTTPHHQVQPSPSEDNDPQNTASPVLPDITNYYTLFPTTLNNGPPGLTPREQSPSSSSSFSTSNNDNSNNTSAASTSSTFSIHVPTLRKEFLHLQSLHHPDKYTSNASAHQKALALSAYINAAYKTLSDPLLRAQYLLQLQYDIDVTSEDNAAHPTDQETLMEVMEAQERVEVADAQGEVDNIKQENAERMIQTERKMGEAFENGDAQSAKEECVRLKYWRSLQGALDEWQPGKEIHLIH